VQLHSGDTLIMVSDGILEARDARGVEYGLSRLSRRIRTAKGSAEDIVKAILADIDAHSGDEAQGDDMTILAMAIETRRAKRKTTTHPGISTADGAASPRLATEGGTPMEGAVDDGDDEPNTNET
jgi:anti-sigma factor ChrR (cupin superfamily)